VRRRALAVGSETGGLTGAVRDAERVAAMPQDDWRRRGPHFQEPNLGRNLALRDALVERIRREVEHARAGRPARIIAKMNALVDRRLIEELYAASAAGVRIDLIVRGICCLRPEVPGLSENIRVISIVDRYLEHARIFHFENAGQPEYLLSSADWMPRNLDRRVELAFPILDPSLQREVREILETQLADTVKARRIRPDGGSERLRHDGRPEVRSQARLYEATGAALIDPE